MAGNDRHHRWMGCVAGGLCLSLLGTPAFAQFYFGPPVLPQRAIVEVLRDEGFRRMSPPVLNRDVYFLDAIDPDGVSVRLIVDAFSGDIIKAHVRHRSAIPEQRSGWDDWDEPPPAAPRSAPAPRKQANAPAPRPRDPVSIPPALRQPPSRPSSTKLPPDPPKPPVAVMPQGSKATPRVIPIAPSEATVPPVAPLDDVPARNAPATPYVPPAPLE